ncbi:MAG TPA: methionine--tRNA ligase [Terriglobia bacterium]
MNRLYLTTPIYYPNARPHVGSAYTTIVCDVLARYKRMCGYDVAFLTGTDEHGEKLQRAADAAGMPVERFVAEKRELFRNLWHTLGISEYRFVHTSQNPAHRESVQWMIRQADKAGYIDKKKYVGRYCISDERYVSDGPEPANCDVCGRPAELISEENYFFKLSAFGPSEPGREDGKLMELYRDNPQFVQPDFRRNEVISFVKSGLRDISISRRRLKWGIPWPGDDEQVVYVWYDALTSYLTGIGFAGEKRSKDFEKYWMGAEGPTEVVHMIGKDILRFHTVYWPAFLMAAGLPLPKTIFAHGWIYYEQDKMSKSKGNVVYPEPIVDAFESFGAPGNDALRYYLLREAPFGHDTSFSYEGLIDRYNSDLANDLGNLANRTAPMINRYFDGLVPKAVEHSESDNATPSVLPVDTHARMLPRMATQTRTYTVNCFDRYEFSSGLAEVWRLIRGANTDLSNIKPWALAKDPSKRDQLAEVLGNAYEVLRFAAALTHPVLPFAARRLWQQLGQASIIDEFDPKSLRWGCVDPGTKAGKPEPIFPDFKRDKREALLTKIHELAEADRALSQPKGVQVPIPSESQPAPAKADSSSPAAPQNDSQSPSKITIDDFAKVEMVVAQIVAAESIPGAKKLLKLQVDIGSETRQVCAGIAEYYRPEELVGQKIVLVANLEPRKLRGIESNGMVVAASAGPEGKPILATFKEDVPNGTRLK